MITCCETILRLKLILIGAPGSGKGTQSKRLAERYNLKHVTSGDLLREEQEKDTKLALKIGELMQSGKLFPDELVKDVLIDNVPACNFILDGYPRKISQISTFKNIDLVIFIDLPQEECINRILHRNEGRADDNKEAASVRFNCFKKETEPVIEYYKHMGILELIDGIGSEDEVFGRITEALFKRFNI
jgi:adenylate kinase